MSKAYVGINIQYPISRLILEGKKTIETRTYRIPIQYIEKDLVIIETPGRDGNFKARIIGIIKFGKCFEYQNERAFYIDAKKHFVTNDSPWKWKKGKTKWGWPILNVRPLKVELPAPINKGIRYTKDIWL